MSATQKSSNGERVWRERVGMFIVLSVFISGVLMFVFVTRGELHAAMLTKANQDKVEKHIGETAHREQVMVNMTQANWNTNQENAISTLATGLKRMELLMVEQMVADGTLSRPTIHRILNQVPE